MQQDTVAPLESVNGKASLAQEPHEGQHFDIVIIGGGPGGYSAALRAAELGKSVALVEEDSRPGGVCLHEGCVPSKALLTAAGTIDVARHASSFGMDMRLDSLDLGRLVEYKAGIVDSMTSGLESLLRRRGVTFIQAAGEVDEPGHVTLHLPQGKGSGTGADAASDGSAAGNGADGTGPARTVTLAADDIILATGSRPRPLPGTAFSHKAILDSTDALNLLQVPQSVIIIGSGAIGIEFARLWNSLGATVTVLEVADRLFPAASRRASALLARQLRRDGIAYHTGVAIQSISEGANLSTTVRYTSPDAARRILPPSLSAQDAKAVESEPQNLSAQFTLIAIGRLPNTTQPWFSRLGVNLDDRGFVTTDAYGRTSVDRVWAVGDVTGGKMLAHRAFAQGIVTAEAIAGVPTTPVDDHEVPSVAFASLPIATVGWDTKAAQANPDFSDVRETNVPTMGNARVQMIGGVGNVTIVSGVRADRPGERVILGAEICGSHAEDLIAEAQELVGNRVPLHEAARLIHPHPTFSETFGEALLSADGRPLHTR